MATTKRSKTHDRGSAVARRRCAQIPGRAKTAEHPSALDRARRRAAFLPWVSAACARAAPRRKRRHRRRHRSRRGPPSQIDADRPGDAEGHRQLARASRIGASEHVNVSQLSASVGPRSTASSATIRRRSSAGSPPTGRSSSSTTTGVLFAPGASVDVGSLFATTLSISDQDFLAGRYQFSNPGNAGSVVNQGNIVTANGYTALVGPQVRNDGIIVARTGTVALAAADRVSLDLIGDGLISLSVDQAALNASVVNTGTHRSRRRHRPPHRAQRQRAARHGHQQQRHHPRQLARRAQRRNRPRRRQRRRGGQ